MRIQLSLLALMLACGPAVAHDTLGPAVLPSAPGVSLMTPWGRPATDINRYIYEDSMRHLDRRAERLRAPSHQPQVESGAVRLESYIRY